MGGGYVYLGRSGGGTFLRRLTSRGRIMRRGNQGQMGALVSLPPP